MECNTFVQAEMVRIVVAGNSLRVYYLTPFRTLFWLSLHRDGIGS